MKKIAGIIFAVAFVCIASGVQTPYAHAETKSITSLTETLKTLMAKIASLQSEVVKAKSDINEAIKDGLREGATDDDIKEIQELLASDPTIYPEGNVTGFFGPMTKEALKRFQKKHNLEESGAITKDTRDLLNQYLEHRSGTSTPKGFFDRSDILNKVKGKFCDHSVTGVMTRTVFCKDYNDDDDDSNDDVSICERARFSSQSAWAKACAKATETPSFSKVTVKVVSGSTTVTFKMGATPYVVNVTSTASAKVLQEVANKLDVDLEDMNSRLAAEITKKLADALRASKGSLYKRAQSALTHAERVLNVVASDIASADSDIDTDQAEELLEDAKDLLEDAHTAFADGEYKKARDLARDAEKKADDAADELADAN